MPTIQIRFGETDLPVEIPTDREVELLEPGSAGDPRPVAEAVAPLLPAIATAAAGARRVAVIVPDDSRPFPSAVLVPSVLDTLREAGVPDDGVVVLVATGLHRAMPEAALRAMLGPDVVDRVEVRNHDARDAGGLVEVGEIVPGIPALLHRDAVEADLRVLLGTCEPHQYHGLSGGWKTLGIGCAGEATIAHTHGRAFLVDDRVRPGASPGNPFREAVAAAARRAGKTVALNLVPGPVPETTLGAAAGEPDDVWSALALRATRVFSSGSLETAADVILAGVPSPKSRSLYQATRAATNLIRCDRPALRPGGTIVLAAPCEDGVGTGEGERRFGEALRTRGAAILDEDTPLLPGEQRAWMVARVLRDHRMIVAGARTPGDLEGLGIDLADDPVAAATALPGRLLVVPDALHVLPGSPGLTED